MMGLSMNKKKTTITTPITSYCLNYPENEDFMSSIEITRKLSIQTEFPLELTTGTLTKPYHILMNHAICPPGLAHSNTTFLKYDVLHADSGDFLLFQMGENPTSPPPLDMELEPDMCLIRDSEGKSEMIRAEFMAQSTMALLSMLPGECYQFHFAWRSQTELPGSKGLFFSKFSDTPVGYWVQIHF